MKHSVLAGTLAILAGSAALAAAANALPGMPAVQDPNDIYAADHAGNLSETVRNYPSRVYVPNSGDNTVDVIDPKTFKIIAHFSSGGHEPQHGDRHRGIDLLEQLAIALRLLVLPEPVRVVGVWL